jgi:ribulose-phosphate 3-epimerase
MGLYTAFGFWGCTSSSVCFPFFWNWLFVDSWNYWELIFILLAQFLWRLVSFLRFLGTFTSIFVFHPQGGIVLFSILFSGLMQWGVFRTVIDPDWSYEQGRLIISGILFIVAYFLHRRFSFRDFKRVGVAIYANGVEDLSSIHEQIGQYPDFIHVDIVDSSFTSNPEGVKAYRMETIKALWRDREIHTHIMSKTPSRWLLEVLPYSDIVYIHWECDEDFKAVLGTIHKAGKKAGLALTMKTTLDDVKEIFKQIDAILLLTISEPGHSGQEFDMEGLKRIEKLNKLPFRDHLRVCVDGGVNEKIIGLVQVEDVVSGSSVLNHINPKQQILRLQTSGRYEVL